ncbi:MAG: MBOAT family protein [Bacteroidota bacterium]
MLFNSLTFGLFLPLVFLLHWFVIRQRVRWQNILIILASYVFYGWWDWRFLSLIMASSLVDFLLGLQLGKTEQAPQRKRLLWLSLAFNLGILGFFKYYNFFVDQFVTAFSSVGLELQPQTLSIILPVGISFYTFQTLSYTIDVYCKKLEPTSDWTVFFAYVAFFPQLVAGPIERATNLIPQFSIKRTFDASQAQDGMRQILWGLFKKIVIADNCAVFVNSIFTGYEELGTLNLILGAVLFAFQIYCDFSGYSDIAIGTARLFGVRLMQNFAYPYFSRSIGEFWRRWHISLSTWFRDYLYIPLGGSRVDSKALLIRNILIIFLVSGFWHGANWTFIVWGGLHALFFLPSILRGTNRKHLGPIAHGRFLPSLSELMAMLSTFSLVCFSWIFFRSADISSAFAYISALFSNLTPDLYYILKAKYLLVGIVLLLLVEWRQRDRQHGLELTPGELNPFLRATAYLSTAMAILLLAPREESVFIYFQF